ncbi:hypothetical protein COU19_01290 [Candidatus Kaiserbacteria bacterium CG10_big_fil_rev_8_21_14_0_10_56_12]|uniref:Uncharacterized protein n=1 Tax=Candidatus Kaiserbacteria bacterium CG10_big_fil_rev_8_21_14_0_10_56_12 TaxID=1974611 RepID=A0A2H0UAB8_9BACT|nr:MAG: hypothetical protein COU19_01290 [Candidatus Kaiserbacteria bacterium CG10_big_fil_rev_8_21_14_0_10_56_12]
MNWAAQRRFTIVAIIAIVVLVIVITSATALFYKAPSCTDHTQNQDEVGVDCGGSCPYLCTSQEQAPVTPTPRLLMNRAGRIDLVAFVQNRNADAAAKNVAYTIKIYSPTLTYITSVTGTLDLPPRTTVPLFIPGVVARGVPGMHATLDVEPAAIMWYRVMSDPRVVPKVDVLSSTDLETAPRVGAALTNSSLATFTNVRLIALVRDATSGNVIAASATIVPQLLPQSRATAIFTWNEPFTSRSITIEVVPVIQLP